MTDHGPTDGRAGWQERSTGPGLVTFSGPPRHRLGQLAKTAPTGCAGPTPATTFPGPGRVLPFSAGDLARRSSVPSGGRADVDTHDRAGAWYYSVSGTGVTDPTPPNRKVFARSESPWTTDLLRDRSRR